MSKVVEEGWVIKGILGEASHEGYYGKTNGFSGVMENTLKGARIFTNKGDVYQLNLSFINNLKILKVRRTIETIEGE
jgi:hypothetical protein